MSGESQRWQGQRSAFPWEQEALDHIKAQMPEAEPYRAWQTFTFTASSGHVREVDLVHRDPRAACSSSRSRVTPARRRTTARPGCSGTVASCGRSRTRCTSPTQVQGAQGPTRRRAARQLNVKDPVPRIEPVVFLSAENLVCRFDEFQLQRVYGRDDKTAATRLPRDLERLPQPASGERTQPRHADLLQAAPEALEKIGIARVHRVGKVGPYELAAKSFDAGPTWEDYLAPTRPCRTTTRAGSASTSLSGPRSDEERKSVQRAAHREYLALQGISHDGIVRAEQYSDELLPGPGRRLPARRRTGSGSTTSWPLPPPATCRSKPAWR